MSKQLETLEFENKQLRKSLSMYNILTLNPNSDVLPSFLNQEPLTSYIEKQNIVDSKNLTGGYRGNLVLKPDDGLKNYYRGTKRIRVESKIPKERDISRKKVY